MMIFYDNDKNMQYKALLLNNLNPNGDFSANVEIEMIFFFNFFKFALKEICYCLFYMTLYFDEASVMKKLRKLLTSARN